MYYLATYISDTKGLQENITILSKLAKNLYDKNSIHARPINSVCATMLSLIWRVNWATQDLTG